MGRGKYRATLLIGAALLALCPTAALAGFELVALGVRGGVEQQNLSAYLIRSDQDTRWLALDAGSLLPGIRQALAKGSLPEATPQQAAPLTPEGYVFRELIAGYFISHGHLDHLAGLLLNAPEDKPRKPIYTTSDTANTLRTHYFNWKSWPNFSDSGNGTRLGTYRIYTPPPGQRFTLADTRMSGVIYPLSHEGGASAMLLIRHGEEAFAYFGDTGADAVERSRHLHAAWEALAPLVQARQLKGIMLESSYADDQPSDRLYGHLTPALLLSELARLAALSGGEEALRGLPVVVTHIKPSLQAGKDVPAEVKQQLDAGNRLGVNFIFMQQGDRLTF